MSRCHVLYWIWLSLCISPGSRASDLLLEYFDEDAQKIYKAGKADYDRLDLSEDVKARLLLKSSEEAKHIYYYCKERGIRLLAYDDPAFPGRLRRIGRRPVLLYCKGRNIDLNDNLMVAMVGTRNMSSYGKRSAYTIAYDLCSAGAVVVSGMALGIDAICHRGVLDASGDTVAVLGCGVDVTYPKQNFELMLELERKGLILSEFKPGTRPSRSTFPIRNRIISGLSQGTLVVEGSRSSGALITARCALSQGRDLFALPGMVGEQNSEGTNALLREGATPVTCAADLLSDYSILYPDKVFIERIPVYKPEVILTPVKNRKRTDGMTDPQSAPAESLPGETKSESPARLKPDTPLPEPEIPDLRSEIPDGLNDSRKMVYKTLLEEKTPLSANQITVRSGMNVAEVMTALTILEIKGYVTALPGGRFILK